MYTLNAPPQCVGGVLREHIARASELLAELRREVLQFHGVDRLGATCRQCAANLDALQIAGPEAIAHAQAAAEDDADVASVVAWLLAESDSDEHGGPERAVAMLRDESPDIGQAAWWGLRLSDATRAREHLRRMASGPVRDFATAAALDLLAFQRQPAHREPIGIAYEDSDDVAWLLAEAGGRTPGAWTAAHLERSLSHGSRRVREASLRASARCGLRELIPVCRDATDRATSPAAVEFLGVVGSTDDLPRLQRVATASGTAAMPIARAGVVALGRLGLVDAMPTLLYLLDEPGLCEIAASAIARITGDRVPRGALPDPPAGMSDDDLDLWEPIAPVDAPRAREWWATRAPAFDSKKRYQAGLCVSDDPLGPLFDRLPLAVRNDVYLRQRALVANTPDWELETWSRPSV